MVFSPDYTEGEERISSLKKEFEITDMGRASWLLRFQITYNEGGIHIFNYKGAISRKSYRSLA